jgi:hypothetical protein
VAVNGGQRFSWASRWWPLLAFAVIGILGCFYGFGAHKNDDVFKFLRFLVDLVVGLAVVVYVIYTRDLARTSQLTADANLEIVKSMRSLLVEEWVAQERPRAEVNLCRGGTELSRVVHIDDQDMPADRYERRTGRERVRLLIFKPMNSGTRVILLRSARIQVSLTPAGRPRELVITPEHPLAIRQDESVEIQVLYDFEGQMDARVVEIDYLDGDRSQNKWVANPWREARYFEPEGA